MPGILRRTNTLYRRWHRRTALQFGDDRRLPERMASWDAIATIANVKRMPICVEGRQPDFAVGLVLWNGFLERARHRAMGLYVRSHKGRVCLDVCPVADLPARNHKGEPRHPKQLRRRRLRRRALMRFHCGSALPSDDSYRSLTISCPSPPTRRSTRDRRRIHPSRERR